MIIFKRKFRFWVWIVLILIFSVILLISFFKGAKPSFGAGGSLTLQPGSEGKDTYTFQMFPGNHGSDADLWSGGGSGTPPSAHTFIQFDLSSVPADITIDSAVLYLYKSGWFGPSGDIDATISANQVTGSWDESSLVSGGDPPYSGSAEATTNITSSNTWYSWDITLLTSRWYGGTSSNFGVVLKHSTESATVGKIFNSSDHGTASLRPKLEIVYTTSGPIPDPDPDPDPTDPDPDPTDPTDPTDPDTPSPTDPTTTTSLIDLLHQPQSFRQLIDSVAKLASESIAPQVVLATAGTLSVLSTLTIIATSLAAQVGIKELIFVLINYGLSFFATKKRDKAGLVYDQISKEPVKGALVNLYDFTTMKLVASAITDQNGHYFFTVKSGGYAMSVVKKGYIFPSHFLKKERSLNDSVYFGQTINISKEVGAINVKIPIDPTAKAKSSRTTIAILMYSSLIRMTIMVVGTLVSVFALVFNPVPINYIMTIGYIVLWVMEYFVQHRELKFSKIIDRESKQPIDLAITRVVSNSGKIKKTYVTDFNGRFIPYLSEQDDFIVIERAGYMKKEERPKKSGFIEGQTYLLSKK